MSDAWAQLVSFGSSEEHLELCNEAMLEVQRGAHIKALRLVANALSQMAANNVSTMDTVDVVNRARDLVMQGSPGVDVEKCLEEAQDLV